ncbi:MAG: LysE family translocator [Sneathiella sp.]|nr:LysE family translocator [Sneathiella sp.]
MWSLVVALIPFAFSLTASPGPNNVIAMATAANFGYWRTVPVIVGFMVGVASMITAAGLGLNQLFRTYPEIHGALKYVAVGYLLYLAWKIARSGAIKSGKNPDTPMSLMQGALFQWVNPKAWIVSISAVTTFTEPNSDPFLQTVIIGTVFVVVGFQSVSLWALFGTVVARFLTSPRALKVFNFCVAGLLVLSLIPLLFDKV